MESLTFYICTFYDRIFENVAWTITLVTVNRQMNLHWNNISWDFRRTFCINKALRACCVGLRPSAISRRAPRGDELNTKLYALSFSPYTTAAKWRVKYGRRHVLTFSNVEMGCSRNILCVWREILLQVFVKDREANFSLLY